jgi:hypothetical protein
MLKKLYSIIFTILLSFLFISNSNAQLSDDFDSYTAGQLLACQNPTNWSTWSNSPCLAGEDAEVSTVHALSGANSVVVVTNNDLVALLGEQTSGTWYFSFNFYVESGKAGYFNILSDFTFGTGGYWAFECYFDAGGGGRLVANHIAAGQPFSWNVDQWNFVQVMVNLDTDQAQFTINNSVVLDWAWTQGSSTGAGPLSIDVADFFGATPNDQMYVDDLWFGTTPVPSSQFFDDFDSYTSGQSLCTQTTEWETWSNAPGGAEDPMVSTNQAYSGSNSVVIAPNNDLIRPYGDLTTGKWYTSFLFYIPSGKSGYFNAMNEFTRPSTFTWGMDSYFDIGGTGRLDTTGGGGTPANSVAFSWAVGQWNQVVVVIDLDASQAEYWIGTNPSNFSMVATWDWTQGGTKPNQLAVNDIFGATANDEMYIDNFYFDDEMPTIVPVELTSFTASVNPLGQAILSWVTATELNNRGFEVERKNINGQFATIGFVEGYGTTSEEKSYTFVDNSVNPGSYVYRLKQIDFNGQFEYSDVIELDVTPPLEFGLTQNYPNPFNPTTSIKFSLAEAGNVKLAIYNMLGEEVSVLIDGQKDAGFFEVNFDASNLSSGTYIYRLEAPGYVEAKKMILMK